MDYEADAWAIRQLVNLQHTRRECLTFLAGSTGYEEDQGSIEGHLPAGESWGGRIALREPLSRA